MDALSDTEFAEALDRLGPFERRPLIAVAVSGGADSLALALLASTWAKARRGRVVALTVDHRLRPESTAEARQIARWLRRHGIAHEILTWMGPYPRSDVQAAARSARYALLDDWCRSANCLHLLTAHHRMDQVETFWLRLARGSGLDGLAAIPSMVERSHCRLLRPLLTVPPERLRARLRAARQPWIEDPSNRNAVYARVRLRHSRAVLLAEGLTDVRLAQTIRQLGRSRRAVERDVAILLARTVRLDPLGFALLERRSFAGAQAEVALRALASLLMAISGHNYPARRQRLERLFEMLASPNSLERSRTLGGCRLVSVGDRIVVCRESAGLEGPKDLPFGPLVYWDNRYFISPSKPVGGGIALAPLGEGPFAERYRAALALVPTAARATLPGLWHGKTLKALTSPPVITRGGCMARLRFRPVRALSPVGFTVV